jgi:tol-pal system protein YbgF
MIIRRVIPLMLLMPAVLPAVSKEMQELMRDVALLQQQVKDLQQAQDTKFAALQVMVQQTLDIASKANTQVAVLESGLTRQVGEQVRGVAASAAGVGSKVDSMGSDVQALRATVEDITSRLGKLQAQLNDLNNVVKSVCAPPVPPPATPGTTGTEGGPPPQGAASNGRPANLPPASTLWENANRDARGGKYDLALQEYQDYLKYYKDMDYAPNAQYNIGIIHYTQKNLEAALSDFDAVLEKYPDNAKTPDALLMKGKTLVAMGRPTQGASEFRDLIKRFPTSDQATQAKAQLKALGLPYNSGAPASSKKRR